jgi:hypothetical protein
MRLATLFMSFVIAWAGSAGAASIGLFSKSDLSSCNLRLPNGSSDHFYVAMFTDGVPAGAHLLGGELRLEGLPESWSVIALPVLYSHNDGDIAGPEGGRLTYDQPQTAHRLFLYTVLVGAHSDVQDLEVHVVMHASPSFDLQCPMLYFDDGSGNPAGLCADGGTLYINSARDCAVSIQSNTWTLMKQLYR